MYFWNSYPFIRLSITLILGVISFDWNPTPWSPHLNYAFLGVLLLITSIYFSGKFGYYRFRHINGLIALLLVYWIGGYLTKTKYHSKGETHYTSLHLKIDGFSGFVASTVNERPKYTRYELDLNQLITQDSIIPTYGKIHLYITKDSTSTSIPFGSRVHVYGTYFKIKGPQNPAEFDYRLFLARQGIHAHAFVNQTDLKVLNNRTINPILSWSFSLRSHANAIIDSCITQPRENGITKAILLGIKDHLDNDLKKAYSAAGAMHVLAVSGLHVGIIYLIIRLLIGWSKERGRWGKYMFMLISILTIWAYACVTGLSPSVLRAATMFTLVAIGEAAIRETNIYNSLGIAAFILLLYDPYLIYAVGFQLSFAAVFGIVYLQPKLYSLFIMPNKLLDKVWSISCVSIAAQVATFPLSTFYFHQFPTYFLLSNLIVIPASFVMLTGGLLLLFIGSVSIPIASSYGLLFQKFVWFVNEVISYFHSLPYSLIEWIHMDKMSLIISYAIMLTFITSIHFGNFKTFLTSQLLIILLLSWNWVDHETQSQTHELIFYSTPNGLAIDHIQGHAAKLYVDELELKTMLPYQINPFRLHAHLPHASLGITKMDEAAFASKDVIRHGIIANRKMTIIDSTTFHLAFIRPITTNYIIINNNSVKSLKWLQKNFLFDQIILGMQNSYFYTRKLKKEAEKLGLTVHSLKDDGALRIPLK